MGPDTPDAVIIAATTSAKKVIDGTNDEKKDTDSPSPKKPKSTKKKKKKVATTKMKKKKSITDDDDDDVDIIVATTSPSATTATTSSNTQSNNASPPKRTKSAKVLIKYKPNKSAKSKISPSTTDAATATATATATTSSDTQSDNASPPKRTKSAKLTRTKSIKSTKSKISPSTTDAATATATATATTSSDTQSDNASPPKRTKSAKLTRTKSNKSAKTKISPSATDAATATATTSSDTQSDNASPPKRTKSTKSLTKTKSNKSTESNISPSSTDTATATPSSDTQSDNASPPKRTKSAMSLTKTKLNKSTKSKISPSATDAATATTVSDTQSNDASPPKRTPPKRTKSAMPLTKTKSSKSTKSKINRTKSLGGEDRKKYPPQRSLSSTGGRGRGWEGGRGRGPGRGRGRGRGRDPSLRGRGMHVSGNGEYSQRMKGGGRGINGGRSNRRFSDTNERGSPEAARERGRSPQAARERGRGPGRGQRPQSMRAGRSMEINSNGRQSSFRQNSFRQNSTRSLRQSSTRSFDTSTHSSRGSGDSWLDEKNELHPEKTKSARNIYMAPAVDLYKDPSKPKSILRKISHNSESNHRSMMPSSSHHARRVSSPESVQKASGRAREENNELYSTDSGASFEDDDYEMYINDNGDDDRSFADEGDPDEKTQQEVSRNIIGSFVTKSLRSIGTMDSGLGTGSSHHNSSPRENDSFDRRSGLARSNPKQTQSTRSMLSLDVMEFQDENTCIRSLRYIRIMAPYPNEDPIKKKIRIFTWVALLLDFVNALVAIITYGGETTQCCGKSIMSAFGGTDYWDLIIKIITCGYMLLIFLEVFPVITGGFPFNLFNPFIGFMITFAVFFSDSMVEAVVMWTIEACAVFCEIYIYRLLLLRFNERKSRLKNTRNEITKLRKIKRKVKNQFENGMFSTRSDSSQDILNIDFSDEDSFADDNSFVDEMEAQKNDNDDHTVVSRTTLVTAAEISTVRETRLLRERRKLILSQTEEERDLRYHFVGVCINTFLVVFSLLMIIIIAKNGGMCIKGLSFGNIFSNDQLDKCNLCVDADGPCEICSYLDDGTTVTPESQCYYPYG